VREKNESSTIVSFRACAPVIYACMSDGPISVPVCAIPAYRLNDDFDRVSTSSRDYYWTAAVRGSVWLVLDEYQDPGRKVQAIGRAPFLTSPSRPRRSSTTVKT
jgi:hypothetical protein